MSGLLEVLNWVAAGVIILCVLAILVSLGRLAIAAATGERLADPIKGVLVPIVAAGAVGLAAGLILAVI